MGNPFSSEEPSKKSQEQPIVRRFDTRDGQVTAHCGLCRQPLQDADEFIDAVCGCVFHFSCAPPDFQAALQPAAELSRAQFAMSNPNLNRAAGAGAGAGAAAAGGGNHNNNNNNNNEPFDNSQQLNQNQNQQNIEALGQLSPTVAIVVRLPCPICKHRQDKTPYDVIDDRAFEEIWRKSTPAHEVQPKMLASGSFGVIFEGQLPSSNRAIALKVFFDYIPVRDFLLEVRSVVRVRHPNIVSILAASSVRNKKHVIVYPLLDSLCQRAAGGASQEEFFVLTPEQKVKVIGDVATGLVHIHNLCCAHRDIKPQNLLIDRLSKPGEIVGLVADLGSFADHATSIFGTPSFLSPELSQMANRSERVGVEDFMKGDIFALGFTIANIFAQKLHDSGAEAVQMITDHVPEKYQSITRRMVAENPEERPTAQEVMRVFTAGRNVNNNNDNNNHNHNQHAAGAGGGAAAGGGGGGGVGAANQQQPAAPQARILCRYVNTEKGCREGEHCAYFHPAVAVQHGVADFGAALAANAQNNNQQQNPPPPPVRERVPCRNWTGVEGSCRRERCPYEHKPLCRNFNGAPGSCSYGDTCRFLHRQPQQQHQQQQPPGGGGPQPPNQFQHHHHAHHHHAHHQHHHHHHQAMRRGQDHFSYHNHQHSHAQMWAPGGRGGGGGDGGGRGGFHHHHHHHQFQNHQFVQHHQQHQQHAPPPAMQQEQAAPPCARRGCPCEASPDADCEGYCSFNCQAGPTPCARKYHTRRLAFAGQ